MRTNICNRRWYNRDADEIDQITIRVDVNDAFNGMSLIIDIGIKMSIVIACLDILTNGFDAIDLNLDKVSEYDSIDQLTAQNHFTIEIGYELYATDPLAVRIDIYTRIRCDCDTTTVGIRMDICDIALAVYILVKISLLISRVDSLTIKFDGMNSTLHKLFELAWDYGENRNVIIIIANMYKICSATLVVALVLSCIYFDMQVMQSSPSNIAVLAELDAVTPAIVQSWQNLAMRSLIDAVYSDTQVLLIYSVCGVFYSFYFFCFLVFLSFFLGFVYDMLLIKCEKIKNNTTYS